MESGAAGPTGLTPASDAAYNRMPLHVRERSRGFVLEYCVLDDVRRAVDDLAALPNVSCPEPEEVKRRAEQFGTLTRYGSCNWVSTVKNRSGALTVHLGSDRVESDAPTQKKRDIRRGASDTIRLVHAYLRKAPLARVECTMGDNSSFAPRCRAYVSVYHKEMVRIAHAVQQTLFERRAGGGPELTVVMIPEWQEKDRQILVFPEIGVTYVLGTDYFGEAKNAFLRMAMWRAREDGMLGLHGGTKIVRAVGPDGRLRTLGMILLGIAGTGKTTHVSADHGLDQPGEGIEIKQDEVSLWRADGSALGTERGFYVKTEGLTRDLQPLLYDAAIQPDALLDNVMVDYQGNVYFDDRTLTANGRAVVQRTDLGGACSESVDLPPIAELDGLVMLFLTRNYTVVPVASRLTPEQATVAYMLSQSIDITGAEAREAMITARDGGANPYLVGEPAEDANRFYELLKANERCVECYMLNTGGVGELVEQTLDGARKVHRRVRRVRIEETAAIIRGIARGTARWKEDRNWMVETPEYIEGLHVCDLDPAAHYDQQKIDSLIAVIRQERARYVEQFRGLYPEIAAAVEF